jgi:ATP synthase subunit 6
LFDFSITNFLFIIALIFIVINLSSKRVKVIPVYWVLFKERIDEVCAQITSESLGRYSEKYFPLTYLIFIFILANNLIGLVPYSFTPTAHIVVTFLLSSSVFIGLNIVGFQKHKLRMCGIFLPPNTAFFLALLLVPIELVSFISKPISLGVRLFINLMAGHTLIKVILTFSWNLIYIESFKFFLLFIPVAVLILLIGLETGVAFIQAYVFVNLTCIYIGESENLH